MKRRFAFFSLLYPLTGEQLGLHEVIDGYNEALDNIRWEEESYFPLS
jgi:hypothetical protein